MNEGMKRLLRCDMIRALKVVQSVIYMLGGMTVIFWVLYGNVPNLMFGVVFCFSISILSYEITDWQSGIGMYISMGITRKNTFCVKMIRGIFLIVLGLLLESVVGSIGYPEYVTLKILLGSLFILIFSQGWGQLSGAIYCEHKKIATVLQLIGWLFSGGAAGAGFMLTLNKEDDNILYVVINEIGMEAVLGFGIVVLLILILGSCLSFRQIRKISVV